MYVCMYFMYMYSECRWNELGYVSGQSRIGQTINVERADVISAY